MRFIAIPKTSVTDVEIEANDSPTFEEQARDPFSVLKGQ